MNASASMYGTENTAGNHEERADEQPAAHQSSHRPGCYTGEAPHESARPWRTSVANTRCLRLCVASGFSRKIEPRYRSSRYTALVS